MGRITMNVLEQMAISILLSLVQATVKNPAKAATVKSQLLGVADDIYEAYGITPPVRS